MRYGYTDETTHTPPAESIFDLSRVVMSDMTIPGSRRNVYVRAMRAVEKLAIERAHFYVCDTLAHANAIPFTTDFLTAQQLIDFGVICYKSAFYMVDMPADILAINHAHVDPDMSGLKLRLNGVGSGDTWNAVYAYTADLSELVTSAIVSILAEYTGAGQALEGFTSGAIVKGEEDLAWRIIGDSPNIITAFTIAEDETAEANMYARRVGFTIVLGRAGLSDQGEATYTQCMIDGDAAWSILGDERKTLDGLVTEVVMTSSDGPEEFAGEGGTYTGVRVRGFVRFPRLSPDR